MNRMLASGVLFPLAGCFCPEGGGFGAMYHDGAPTAVVTTFYSHVQGEQLYGFFAYVEEESGIPGTLTDCEEMPERKAAYLWHRQIRFRLMRATDVVCTGLTR
jgi:hypothetical protein